MTEMRKTDDSTGETYIMLTASGPFPFLDTEEMNKSQGGARIDKPDAPRIEKSIDRIHFVPYYYRGNRDGKGHMRVGLRRA